MVKKEYEKSSNSMRKAKFISYTGHTRSFFTVSTSRTLTYARVEWKELSSMLSFTVPSRFTNIGPCCEMKTWEASSMTGSYYQWCTPSTTKSLRTITEREINQSLTINPNVTNIILYQTKMKQDNTAITNFISDNQQDNPAAMLMKNRWQPVYPEFVKNLN